MYIYSGSTSTVAAYIANCVFDGNGYNSYGGAIYVSGGRVNVYDSVFERNSANIGGAIYLYSGETTIYPPYTFSNNVALFNSSTDDL